MKKRQGRPPFDLTDKVLATVENMAAGGCTQKQIAAKLGISEETFRVKKKYFPAFSHAIKKGQAKALPCIENALFQSAMNGNVRAIIFYLKNRVPEVWKY